MTELNPSAFRHVRRRGLTLIAAAIGVCALTWGGWHWLNGRHRQSTDNAYVAGNVVQITPQVGGTVVAIQADDTDFVQAGQVLVKLDPADARVALDQAEAQLAQTVREVRTLFANTGALQAQVQAREADLARLQSDLARAREHGEAALRLDADNGIARLALARVLMREKDFAGAEAMAAPLTQSQRASVDIRVQAFGLMGDARDRRDDAHGAHHGPAAVALRLPPDPGRSCGWRGRCRPARGGPPPAGPRCRWPPRSGRW